jgi:hypothetical protein
MSLRWQAHVYGEVRPALRDVCDELQLELYQFPWRPVMKRNGLARDSLYLVRPDGYVALALADTSSSGARALRDYAARWRSKG